MERDGGQLGVLHRVAWPGWCWETCWIGCNYGCTLNWSARWMTGYPTDQSSNQPKIHQGSGKLKQWQTSRNWGNPELAPLSRLTLHCYSQSSSARCENRSSRFQTTSKFLSHSCPKLNQPSSRWRLKKSARKTYLVSRERKQNEERTDRKGKAALRTKCYRLRWEICHKWKHNLAPGGHLNATWDGNW